MHHIIQDLSTPSLERLVTLLTARIIAGTASHHDIESYMRMQLEIAERTEPFAAFSIEPGD
ncbi:hypothetical protein BH23DEI1_BH23DEI1_02800 [soil metagenome]